MRESQTEALRGQYVECLTDVYTSSLEAESVCGGRGSRWQWHNDGATSS